MTIPNYLDHILNGAMVLDKDFNVMFWNHWLEIQTGIKKSTIVGSSLLDYFPGINKNMLNRKLRQVFTLNTPAFINAEAEKYLLKIPTRKLSGSIYENMLQNVVISVYDKEAGYALFMIYDQTSLFEARAGLEISARKLKEQHILLQNTMDFQSNIIFVIDKNKIINCNNNFLEMLGYDIMQKINSGEADMLDFVAGCDRNKFHTLYDFIESSLKTNEISKISVRSSSTGISSVFLFSARRMPENQNIMIVSMTDITLLENREKVLQDINMELSRKYDEKNSELKKLNQALVRSSNQLQLAQELANVGSLEYNFSDGSIYVSQVFTDIFERPGLALREIYGLMPYFTDEYRSHVNELLEKSIETGSDFSSYAEITTNEGEPKPLSIHGRFFGKVREESRLLITVQDLTNIKLLEKQISDKEKLLTSIFDVADIAFIILDPEKKIYRVNKEFEIMTGYTGENVIGKPIDFLGITPHKSDYEKYMRTDNGTSSEVYLHHSNGSKLYAYMNISKYSLDADENFTVCALTDITDRIEILAEQKEQEQLLIQQSKMAAMGEMIGVIAHQWKQPLNILNLILDNVKTSVDEQIKNPAEIDKAINTCFTQVRFMADTVDDFKNFFKHDNSMVRFNAVDTVSGIIKLLSPLFSKNGTKINVTNRLSHSAYVYGIPNEFSHTLMNIMSNSKDAINAKVGNNRKFRGYINIDIADENNRIDINICDNGGGIPAGVIEHIFEPYFTTKGDKGTGIGMYLAKIIINKKMNGDISVTNINDGTCIRISLPMAPGTPSCVN